MRQRKQPATHPQEKRKREQKYLEKRATVHAQAHNKTPLTHLVKKREESTTKRRATCLSKEQQEKWWSNRSTTQVASGKQPRQAGERYATTTSSVKTAHQKVVLESVRLQTRERAARTARKRKYPSKTQQRKPRYEECTEGSDTFIIDAVIGEGGDTERTGPRCTAKHLANLTGWFRRSHRSPSCRHARPLVALLLCFP